MLTVSTDRLDLKRQKEAFVSNLEGTTKWEIFCVIGCLPLCLIFAAVAEHWTQSRLKAAGYSSIVIRLATFGVEFAVVVLPQVAMSMSVAPAEPCFLSLFLLWATLSLKTWRKLFQGSGAKHHFQQLLQQLAEPRKRFISAFRGGIMLYTCVGILAVDFHAFPRRYAKAENFGQGLMDMGVGAIVFAGGIASKAAHQDSYSHISLPRRLLVAVRSTSPLLLLGMARLLTTKAAQYQEHVGEYGVHWNFFLTSAAVNLLTMGVWVPRRLLAPVGLLVTAAHQAVLTAGGLSGWVQSEERGPGLVSLNKEGLTSLWGYWALHLLGAAAGDHLRSGCTAAIAAAKGALAARGAGKGQAQQAGDAAHALWNWVGQLAALDAVLWAAAWAAEAFVEPVSRRACNMAYVLWVTALCLCTIILCLATELLAPQLLGRPAANASMQLLSSINRNMLALFLFGNVLTGAVNLSINTLAVGDWEARGVVGAYMLIVCALSYTLDTCNITLKFW